MAALDIVRQGADVMPRSQLDQVLDAELGPDWSSKLISFNYDPIASASIGQVRRDIATLLSTNCSLNASPIYNHPFPQKPNPHSIPSLVLSNQFWNKKRNKDGGMWMMGINSCHLILYCSECFCSWPHSFKTILGARGCHKG